MRFPHTVAPEPSPVGFPAAPAPDRAAGEPLRIVIVEDDEVLASLLAEHLAGDSRFAPPRIYCHARSGVSGVKEFQAHAVLVDLRLKGSSGFDCIRRIRAECPPTRVLAFTASDDQESILGALKAGAEGYLVKGQGLREVADAMVALCSGTPVLSDSVLPKVIASFHQSAPTAIGLDLTPMEQAVLDFTANGLDCKEIARNFGISVHTIYIHNKNILRKLRVTNRHAAAALWRQRAAR